MAYAAVSAYGKTRPVEVSVCAILLCSALCCAVLLYSSVLFSSLHTCLLILLRLDAPKPLTTNSQPPLTQAAACLLKGYIAHYPLLPEIETPHLLTLACARLATSVTLGAYSYAQDPTNKYLLIHAEPAWAALRTLWCR